MVIKLSKEADAKTKVENYLIKNSVQYKLIKEDLIVTSSEFKDKLELEAMADIDEAIVFDTDYQLVTRKYQMNNTVIDLGGGVSFGENRTVMMAGPCAVESEYQAMKAAEYLVNKHDVKVFRAGSFKPRTSPYTFQGLEDEGLKILDKVKREFNVKIITEIKDESHLEIVAEHADIIQIGTKSMYLFNLLKACGKIKKPILLKRGFMSTVKEFLQAAEFILSEGNSQVILCERGIRTFEPETRFCLDVGSAALIKQISHLPIVLDPTHAVGKSKLVTDVANASAGIGIDGMLIEVHPNPAEAMCDKEQALTFQEFAGLYDSVGKICKAVGRSLV